MPEMVTRCAIPRIAYSDGPSQRMVVDARLCDGDCLAWDTMEYVVSY